MSTELSEDDALDAAIAASEAFARAKRALAVLGLTSPGEWADALRKFIDHERDDTPPSAALCEYIEDVCSKIERREIERERQARNSCHLGKIGERQEFTARVQFTKTFPPREEGFDESKLTILHDDNGCAIKYWNFINVPNEVPEPAPGYNPEEWKKTRPAIRGERVIFSAKVVQHDEYQGVKQTQIQRVTKARLA